MPNESQQPEFVQSHPTVRKELTELPAHRSRPGLSTRADRSIIPLAEVVQRKRANFWKAMKLQSGRLSTKPFFLSSFLFPSKVVIRKEGNRLCGTVLFLLQIQILWQNIVMCELATQYLREDIILFAHCQAYRVVSECFFEHKHRFGFH